MICVINKTSFYVFILFDFIFPGQYEVHAGYKVNIWKHTTSRMKHVLLQEHEGT